MIPKWLNDSIKAGRQFNAGDAELSMIRGEQAWCFGINKAQIPIKNHRVEFVYSEDNYTKLYEFTGRFLIPSWCDFSLGSAVIMQWHGADGTYDYVPLRIDNAGKDLIVQINRDEGRTNENILTIPLIRDKWITFKGNYHWNYGGRCVFSGLLDGVSFRYSGNLFQNMYQKFGCYRNGNLEGEYPAVQVWWTGCEKQAIEP